MIHTARETTEQRVRMMTAFSPMAKAFLAGSFSGTCSTILFQPLDLVKTRVQKVPDSRVGMCSVIRNIVASESLTGLWRGVTPSLVRTVPGVGLYFSTMHTLKTQVCDGAPTPTQSLAIGATARTISGLLTIPITVVKIRREAGNFRYRGTAHALASILRHEGLRGLTSGLVATLARDVPFSSLYLMFYEKFKQFLSPGQHGVVGRQGTLGHLPPSAVHFLSGLCAGVAASIITQPADVVKTRQQLSPKPRSMFSIFVEIGREQGVRGFFRGSVPRLLRRTMMAALAWTVYEKALRNFGLK